MKRFAFARCSAVILLGIVAGCERHAVPAAASAPPATSAPASMPSGSARIQGRITYTGPKFEDNVITVTDPGCNCDQVIEPGEKVSADGGLADAIVYLDLPASGDGVSQPTVTLDQVHCNYSPHVLAVQTNETINIRSSDPTHHNVRYESARNSTRNIDMSTPGESIPLRFAQPEFINFRCDVHPWMSAWVGVFAHPYFCVTDEHGHFSIEHLPAGDYTLVAWHEVLGSRRIKITVGSDATVQQDVVYSSARGER